MTEERALEILTEPDRIGCNLTKANDTEANTFNAESIEALKMAIGSLSRDIQLKKIREEIKQFAENPDFGDLSLGASCGATRALEIMDKYMKGE